MAYRSNKTGKVSKEVRYLNKDFSQLRNNLIEFSKQYYPNTYQDFNESSPGMMFIEMASYVGDVMSYYIDSQFKESLLGYSEELRTLYAMAQTFGYKPRISSPSQVTLDIFQLVPAKNSGNDTQPDFSYALTIPSGARIKSTSGITFRTIQDCNFNVNTTSSPRTQTIFEQNPSTQQVTFYLLKKQVQAQSGAVTSEDHTFTNAQKYSRVLLSNQNIIEIISVVDSDGNNWNEVDSLAQDTVFDEVENNSNNDPGLAQFSDDAPYLLKLKRVSRRFTTYRRPDGKTELRFGAGISDNSDEDIVPNPDNVGSNLPDSPSKIYEVFDPSNFLKTKTYGLAPSNTTLTITYQFGGGVQDNVGVDTITEIDAITLQVDTAGLNQSTLDIVKTSVAVSNPEASTGGLGLESVEELRENIKAFFQAQGRAVTKEDYIIRTYALPDKFGNISKAYIVQDDQLSGTPQSNYQITQEDVGKKFSEIQNRIPNPLALNLYVLGYNSNKQLSIVNDAVKENLKVYLSRFRPVTDAVNIKNGYIINIGVNYQIITKSNFLHDQVVGLVNERVKEFFNIDNWQINQPIVLSDLGYEMSLVDGVASVVDIKIVNKFETSEGYSGNGYDVDGALKNGILYPSLDPSIFEVKYPDIDIQGSVVGTNVNEGGY
tara:strand:- start:292 stop:2259 length:1968 start_codon:yes stop_codon:yes gene_type:complete